MNLLHRTERSRVNSYIYGQLIFDHVPKHYNNGKYNLDYMILELVDMWKERKRDLGPLN